MWESAAAQTLTHSRARTNGGTRYPGPVWESAAAEVPVRPPGTIHGTCASLREAAAPLSRPVCHEEHAPHTCPIRAPPHTRTASYVHHILMLLMRAPRTCATCAPHPAPPSVTYSLMQLCVTQRRAVLPFEAPPLGPYSRSVLPFASACKHENTGPSSAGCDLVRRRLLSAPQSEAQPFHPSGPEARIQKGAHVLASVRCATGGGPRGGGAGTAQVRSGISAARLCIYLVPHLSPFFPSTRLPDT